MAIPILVIVGPTGSGKTETAVRVAREIGGEIVTADSMQIYRGMDIGTAKPTPAEQMGIPHHLIDIADPDERFTVTDYVTLADNIIGDICQRKKVPVLSGGTGLYVSSLINRWQFPPQPDDRAFRELLHEEAKQLGGPALHERLRNVDKASAERLHPHDIKRVIRALEVYHLTGLPLSSYQYRSPVDGISSPYLPLFFGLTIPRELLHERLENRVHEQLDAGLLDEVRSLHDHGYDPELPAMKGITYRQLLGYLRGEYDLPTAVELMVRDNRRYARRQYTWFHADTRIKWIDMIAVEGPAGAAHEIISDWQNFSGGEKVKRND